MTPRLRPRRLINPVNIPKSTAYIPKLKHLRRLIILPPHSLVQDGIPTPSNTSRLIPTGSIRLEFRLQRNPRRIILNAFIHPIYISTASDTSILVSARKD